MKIRAIPIRIRLAAWYFAIMALGMSALGWLALAGMKSSFRATVDEHLADRMNSVVELLIRSAQGQANGSLANEFREHSELGTEESLLQVADEDGNWIYQSRWIKNHPLPNPIPVGRRGPFANVRVGRMPLRIMSRNVAAGGHSYTIQVAEAMDDYYEAVGRFHVGLLVLTPLLLIAASVAGYWMSQKALAPVDQITKAAQNIHAHNLSARVTFPQSRDEVQRLGETLNAMLERIDSAMKKTLQFTADASHELRTPVALMRTRAELALRHPRTEPEYRETIEQLHAELVRTSGLVERLMLLSRADSGAIPLRFSPLDLTEIVRDVVQQSEALAEHKQVSVQANLADDPVRINGDPQFLRQLLMILIDNALKYTPAPGSVTVTLTKTETSAVVSVSDTGIGIDASDLENIFDRFYRADKARSRESGGAGLGLAIGRWIVETHGGTITVESKTGTGSSFRVTLPLQPDK